MLLRKIENLEELKSSAVSLQEDKEMVCYEDYTYCFSNGILAFWENKTLYVIPYFKNAVKILKKNNFKKEDFFVPFSDGSYPIVDGSKWWRWRGYLNEAKMLQYGEFKAECLNISKLMGIEPISEELLKDECMEIPEKGLKVEHPIYGVDIIYPIINSGSYWVNWCLFDYIGKYNTRFDVVTFVNADGKQYVTKNWKRVYDEIQDKGYTKACMPVPLSDCERILDFHYYEKWSKLTLRR